MWSVLVLSPFPSDERTILTVYIKLHFLPLKSLRLLNWWEALLSPEVKRRKSIQVHKEVAFFFSSFCCPGSGIRFKPQFWPKLQLPQYWIVNPLYWAGNQTCISGLSRCCRSCCTTVGTQRRCIFKTKGNSSCNVCFNQYKPLSFVLWLWSLWDCIADLQTQDIQGTADKLCSQSKRIIG